MMLYLPFIYYSLLLLYILRKQGLSIAACMVGVYMVTSFLSIFLYHFTDSFEEFTISVAPAIMYCIVPTLVIWPFYRFNSNIKREISCTNTRVFDILSYIVIGCFLFSVLFYASDLLYLRNVGLDIGSLRGDEDYLARGSQSQSSGILRMISSICNAIGSMSSISLILCFYSICFMKRKAWFNALLFLSSMSCIIVGIVSIDRSIIFYWIIRLIFIFVMFIPYFSKQTRRIITISSLGILGIVGIYLIVLTLSRFGSESINSILYYFGQNYLYFCWYWDNYVPPVTNYGFFCPIISHFFLDWGYPVDAVPFGLLVSDSVGYFVNVFYTFMGSIMLYLGKSWIVPLSMVFIILTLLFIRKDNKITLYDLIFVFLWAQIPYCGVILYLYTEYVYAMGFMFVLLYCIWARRREGAQGLKESSSPFVYHIVEEEKKK